MALILRYFTEFGSFGADYVKADGRPILSGSLRQKCSPKNLVFSDISLMTIFAEVTENECIIIERHVRNIDSLRRSL